jgi:hypothetical protein
LGWSSSFRSNFWSNFCLLAGTLIFHIGICEPFAFTKLYALEFRRLQPGGSLSGKVLNAVKEDFKLTTIIKRRIFFILSLFYLISCKHLYFTIVNVSSGRLSQHVASLVEECDRIKFLLHTHSFTYDYHLVILTLHFSTVSWLS